MVTMADACNQSRNAHLLPYIHANAPTWRLVMATVGDSDPPIASADPTPTLTSSSTTAPTQKRGKRQPQTSQKKIRNLDHVGPLKLPVGAIPVDLALLSFDFEAALRKFYPPPLPTAVPAPIADRTTATTTECICEKLRKESTKRIQKHYHESLLLQRSRETLRNTASIRAWCKWVEPIVISGHHSSGHGHGLSKAISLFYRTLCDEATSCDDIITTTPAAASTYAHSHTHTVGSTAHNLNTATTTTSASAAAHSHPVTSQQQPSRHSPSTIIITQERRKETTSEASRTASAHSDTHTTQQPTAATPTTSTNATQTRRAKRMRSPPPSPRIRPTPSSPPRSTSSSVATSDTCRQQ